MLCSVAFTAIPDQKRVGRHGVCPVGYQDAPGSAEPPGGGHCIFRNNWGTQSGYVTVSYAYVERYCQEAYMVERVSAASKAS